MKTAIVMAGDSRTFKDCYPSLESCILSRNTCDVFLHLYEDECSSDVIKTYSPKSYLLESKTDVRFVVPVVCEKNKAPETDVFSLMCQWRNIQKAFSLVDSDYDCVLKTRYDVKYTNPLVVNEYNMNCLNVPIGGDWRGGLFDMVAFASHSIMKNYCSLFSKMEEYCESGVPCHSEILNRFNNRSIPLHRFEYTVLLRKQFDRGYIEDRVFTLR